MWRRFLNNQNWNIGFTECTPNNLISRRKLPSIQWMKHPYRDRFFADPFILDVSDSEIILFVEELEFRKPKGRLVELRVDKKTKRLLQRYVLLELDTHLSYPAIRVIDNKVYVYPENGASGSLGLYVYNRKSHSLEFKDLIINEPLTDATIFQNEDGYWLFATKVPLTQENLYLYHSSFFDKSYTQVAQICVGREHSRPAGNLFVVDKKIYRPAQRCIERYGAGIEILEIVQLNHSYQEKKICLLRPNSFRYNLGLHTINFYQNLCVVDGYGYLYPCIGRVLNYLWHLKKKFIEK